MPAKAAPVPMIVAATLTLASQRKWDRRVIALPPIVGPAGAGRLRPGVEAEIPSA